jgi:hypothetical protein
MVCGFSISCILMGSRFIPVDEGASVDSIAETVFVFDSLAIAIALPFSGASLGGTEPSSDWDPLSSRIRSEQKDSP